MKFYDYENYEQYKASQIATNKKKLARDPNLHQVNPETLNRIAQWIQTHGIKKGTGICHGARNAYEVKVLSKLLPDYEVIGTDISPTAIDYGLIEWDFHKRKEEWVGMFGFVYCNCLDHAQNPERAIFTWLDQLDDYGCLFVEWTPFHDSKTNDPNCFMASKEEYLELLDSCGVVVDVMEFSVMNVDPSCTMPKRKPYDVAIFVVRRV